MKSSPQQIKEQLDNFYDSIQIENKTLLQQGMILTLSFKGKLVEAQAVGSIRIGKATVIKSGEKYFIIQQVTNPTNTATPNNTTTSNAATPNKVVLQNKNLQIYRPPLEEEEEGNLVVIVVLSAKKAINDSERNNPDYNFELQPSLQVVEDILVLNPSGEFSNLEIPDLTINNASTISEPFLAFYNFLKQSDSGVLSFSNYLQIIQDEPLLEEEDFSIDSELDSQKKLQLLGLPLVFKDWSLPLNFTFVTATKVEETEPFEQRLNSYNQTVNFIKSFLLYFVSNSTIHLKEVVNLVVLNNLILPIEDYFI